MLTHRICSDVVAGVVTKCLNARPKTKEASIQVCLMCVEIEQHAVVQVSPFCMQCVILGNVNVVHC